MPNKLINEKSPYLLQHANNPVEWYPWNEEALRLSKTSGKPIFLSIGYATCHWCHVMEHESFENPDIAALMNKHFINIKVDREERPDLDAIYMAAVQALTGSGGWPMSVWLTPDLKPFYGGTYFPPEDRYGRPGFPTVLTQLADIYKNEPEKVTQASADLTAGLKSMFESISPENQLPNANEILKRAFDSLKISFDSSNGGFGSAPKFPMPAYLDFLLLYYARTGQTFALEMVKKSIEKMARGGIYDQLGGGFSRYSTDEHWVVPHFEKMLYDNSQLISTCAMLYQATKDPVIASLVQSCVDYVLRDLRHSAGGFYSAEDADSEGKEGTFYLWTLAEVKNILPSAEADLFAYVYGLSVEGNFFDPHTREPGKNVLIQARTLAEAARQFQLSLEEIQLRISKAKQTLFDVRKRRPRPFRDEKIITEWNGLMISALVHAGTVLSRRDYVAAAEKTAAFLKQELYDAASKTLYRRWRDGHRAIAAHQIDYALLVRGLIDLFQSTGEWSVLGWAKELHEQQDLLFYDNDKGGYFMTVETPDLLIRMKDEGDNVIPSGNSVACLNGLKLSVLLKNNEFQSKAIQTFKTFSRRMTSQPTSLCAMIGALDFEVNGHWQIVLAGKPENTEFPIFTTKLWSQLIPQKVVILRGIQPNLSSSLVPDWIQKMEAIHDRPTAYICKNFTCQKPTTDVEVFNEQLQKLNISQ